MSKRKSPNANRPEPAQKWMDRGTPTSIDVLESTLIRLIDKYTAFSWAGHKTTSYPGTDGKWRGLVWDACIIRAVQVLMKTANVRVNWGTKDIDKDGGRPTGITGEKRFQGCKTGMDNTRQKVVIVDGKKRVWHQIRVSGATAWLLDEVAGMYEKRSGVRWSRQKIITHLSRLEVPHTKAWCGGSVVIGNGVAQIPTMPDIKRVVFSSCPAWCYLYHERKEALNPGHQFEVTRKYLAKAGSGAYIQEIEVEIVKRDLDDEVTLSPDLL
jgi:hypothetical protein